MLIEINLLPKKQKKNIANYLTFLIALTFVGLGFLFFQYQCRIIQGNTTGIFAQKQEVEAQRLIIEQEMESIGAENAMIEQQKQVIDVIMQTIHTTEVIAETKRQLPENAVIRNYTYTDDATMTFQLVVDRQSDVGTFVENLNTISWVQQADFVSVTLGNDETGQFLGSVTVTLDTDALSNQN